MVVGEAAYLSRHELPGGVHWARAGPQLVPLLLAVSGGVALVLPVHEPVGHCALGALHLAHVPPGALHLGLRSPHHCSWEAPPPNTGKGALDENLDGNPEICSVRVGGLGLTTHGARIGTHVYPYRYQSGDTKTGDFNLDVGAQPATLPPPPNDRTRRGPLALARQLRGAVLEVC